jgi:hypothetical protein
LLSTISWRKNLRQQENSRIRVRQKNSAHGQ